MPGIVNIPGDLRNLIETHGSIQEDHRHPGPVGRKTRLECSGVTAGKRFPGMLYQGCFKYLPGQSCQDGRGHQTTALTR